MIDMNADQTRDLLDIGLYTPQEAAMYAGVTSTQKLVRWVYGTRVGEPVIRAQLADDKERTITFIDFIQALAIRTIRHQFPQVTLQKLRGAVEHAASKYDLPYPFAMEHTTYIVGRDVVIRRPGEQIEDDTYIELTGKHRDQVVIKKVFEPYMQHVEFDAEARGLAMKYFAYHGKVSGEFIYMDPREGFGQPMLPCGFTAQALYDAYISEGGVEAAADMYEVSASDITLAIEYYDTLPVGGRRAA